MMIRITDKSLCCGCTACQAVCPYDAITMHKDALGFPYPVVDEKKCIACGLCVKTCDFIRDNEDVEASRLKIEVNAVRNKDRRVLSASQSGGVFSALSDRIIAAEGVVYGAVMDAAFEVRHQRADGTEGRDRMRGSKYVQSDMTGIFRMVKADLQAGRKVLFSGTPCQVAGLASYLPQGLKDNLLLVDFICHGVPSPAVWRDYVSYMERKGPLSQVCFRDKSVGGWKEHRESFVYKDGRKAVRDTFRVLFYKNIMLRHSCAVCPYHWGNRKADVTIADFWGIDMLLPGFVDAEGASMVLCCTEKGRKAILESSPSLDMASVVVDADFLMKKNPNLLRPSAIYKDREAFEKAYSEKGFLYVARRWGDMGWRYKAWQLKVFVRELSGRK